MIGPQPAATARVPPHHSAAPPTFGVGGRGPGAFPPQPPRVRRHRTHRRAARDRVCTPRRRAITSISTTPAAASTPSRSCARTSELLRAQRLRQSALRSTRPRSAVTALVERARAAVLRYFNASPDEYACIFTPNATGALKLVGESYPFAPGGRFLAHLRQSQLGERHPRVRARQRRGDDVCAGRRARRCASTQTRLTRLSGRQTVRSAPNLFAYPGAVELLRRAASARVDRGGAGRAAGTCSSTARPSCRPTGSTWRRWHPDFVADLLLQDVRLPDRRRLPAGPQGAPLRTPATALVRGRHDHRRVRCSGD